MIAAAASARAAAAGSARSACPSASSSASGSVPRVLAIAAARMTSVVTWVTNVFDAATAISGPGLQEEDRVGLAGDGRADRVGDRDDRAAALAGEAGRGDRVGGLARLGDGDDQRPLVERRRAVAELRADVRPGRQAGPVLERGRPDERRRSRRCRRRSARSGSTSRSVSSRPSSSSTTMRSSRSTRPAMRLAERFGLLVDLLEHEVLVAALLGGLGRPVDGRHRRARAGRPSTSVIGHAPRPEVGDVAVLEEDDPVGVGEDRGDVRGEEALAVAEPDDERHVLAGADQPVALADVHDHDRVGALELAQGVAGRRRRGRPRRPPRRDGRSPRCRSRRSGCGRAPRARRAARGSSR